VGGSYLDIEDYAVVYGSDITVQELHSIKKIFFFEKKETAPGLCIKNTTNKKMITPIVFIMYLIISPACTYDVL
jgi:hypothetical protein